MKLSGFKPKKKSRSENEDDSPKSPYESTGEDSGGSAPDSSSWAVTDASQYEAVAKAAKGGPRAPEFFMRSGDKAVIRFRNKEPIATFQRYNIMVGKSWVRFTRPGKGQPDLLGQTGKWKPQTVFLYEVLNRTGYVSKKGVNAGKHLKDIPQFYLVGARQFDQLKMARESVGLPLTKFDIAITRSGQGQQTNYMFMPRPPQALPEHLKQKERIGANWTKYYAPPSLKEQKQFLATNFPGGVDDDED